MKIKVLRTLDECELWCLVNEACPQESSSRRWTEKVICSVSKSCSSWVLGSVRCLELGEVVIPWHQSGADGNYDVVPPEGLPLHVLASQLDTRIRDAAPMFYERIEILAKAPLGNIFLSQVMPKDVSTYGDVHLSTGQFTILDGLHRLVSAAKLGLGESEVKVVAALE